MKKLLISALALASLVACSKEEVLNQQQSSAISFKQAFVDNSTRAAEDPSTTNATLTAFDVWGFMDYTEGVVFDQQRVTGEYGGEWSYSPAQYWLPGHDYFFAAIAPVDDANVVVTKAASVNQEPVKGVGTVKFTNVNGTTDLLYSATTVSTHGKKVPFTMEPVALTFNHLLSKVKFSFTNGFLASNYSIKVSNIKMEVPGDATIDLNVENWWDNVDDWNLGNTTTVLEFGNMNENERLGAGLNAESDFERLTIPAAASQEYTVTFDVELYVGNVLAHTNTLSTKISGAALNMGKAYNFHATLDQSNVAGEDLTPIVFSVSEVKEWENGDGHEGNKIDTKVISVNTVAEFDAAIADGATNFRLVAPINETLNFITRRAVAGEYVLDLNGMNITSEGDAIVVAGGKLTITGNGNVRGANNSGNSGNAVWAYNGAVVNIYGGNYSVNDDADNTGDSRRNDCIYAGSTKAQTPGYINIYGGTFSVDATEANFENGQYWVLNLSDKTNSEIHVYGGTFVNFNPANNKSENPPVSFLAEGYISVQEGNNYVVYPKGKLQEVDTEEELVVALNAGGENIVLTGDIQLANPLKVSTTAVVNLNGKTLSIDRGANAPQNYVFLVLEGGNLTINGNGNVAPAAHDFSIAVWAYGGDVVINGGNYTNAGEGSDLILADKGSVVTINGGVFKACEKQPGVDGTNQKYSALNCKDNSGSSFVVCGGTFFGFNPANNASEGPKTNFVAAGYKSYAVDADWFAVVKE